MIHPDASFERFTLKGDVYALAKGAPLDLRVSRPPSRPMGGWLMTYGKIGPDGGIVPTVDRDGHTMDAARQLGDIDWSGYLSNGRWNDTHRETIIVGLPDSLEFHDGSTPLSQLHGKVGYWTTGHLFDPRDPSSWNGLGRTPSPLELERADHFWRLATLLEGLPRPLGLSAHGRMALSPCRKRIIACEVPAAAVCEVPVNPDATLERMELALQESPFRFLRKGMVGADACGACRCPAGACEGLLRKGVTSRSVAFAVPEDLEGTRARNADNDEDLFRATVKAIMERFFCDERTATRWLVTLLKRRSEARPDHDHDAT